MNNYCSRVMIKGAVVIMAVVLLSISASSVRAQLGRISERDRNILDREMQITLLEKGAKGTPKPEQRLLLQEINEDFARLQLVNNEMKLKNSADVVLDFKYVSDTAAEIKKRSSRLRTNLVFPESARADKSEKPAAEGLMSQLEMLDRLIRRCVTNPVFTDAGVINAELAAKARGDLDEIIDLSDKVKKHAAKLSKAKADSK